MSSNEERYLLQALEFEGPLRAYLHRHTQEESAVEDLLQETYARLLAAGPKTPEVHSVRAFSLRIARDVASEWLRQRQRDPAEVGPELEAVETDEPGQPVEEIVRRRQELARLVAAIQGLPKRARQVFTLRKVYGYSAAQITSRLGVPAQLVADDLTGAALLCAQIVFGPGAAPQRRRLLDRFRIRLSAHEPGG